MFAVIHIDLALCDQTWMDMPLCTMLIRIQHVLIQLDQKKLLGFVVL